MVDKSKIEEAVKLLLEGIGEDVDQGRAQGKRLCGSPGCMKRKFSEGWMRIRCPFVRKQFRRKTLAGIVLEKDTFIPPVRTSSDAFWEGPCCLSSARD